MSDKEHMLGIVQAAASVYDYINCIYYSTYAEHTYSVYIIYTYCRLCVYVEYMLSICNASIILCIELTTLVLEWQTPAPKVEEG